MCIDGILGVGKTTQIVLFRNYLKRRGIECKIFNFKEVDDTEYTKKLLNEMDEWKENNPNSIALCDGSIATDIVDDIANHLYGQDFWDKHKNNLQLYEKLNHKYNFINILITPTDISICEKRAQKKATMSNTEHDGLSQGEKEHLRITANGLKNFDSHMLTYNIKFLNIDIDSSETMLDVHHDVVKTVESKSYIEKPSEEG